MALPMSGVISRPAVLGLQVSTAVVGAITLTGVRSSESVTRVVGAGNLDATAACFLIGGIGAVIALRIPDRYWRATAEVWSIIPTLFALLVLVWSVWDVADLGALIVTAVLAWTITVLACHALMSTWWGKQRFHTTRWRLAAFASAIRRRR